MIYDSLEHHRLYEYNERYKRAFAYILGYKDQEPGRYDLGDGVIALVQSRPTEPREKRRFETHRRYADIQYLLEGAEVQAHTLNGGFEAPVPYNEETDVTYFRGEGKEVVTLPMKPGYFTLYFPHDYHMPIIGDGSTVRKIVMKVLLDEDSR
jgi:YhcH/YjgK/YiaL family protein